MIPRHRERFANAIGKAVGEELVSQNTRVVTADFLQENSNGRRFYTTDPAEDYSSLIEALPKAVRNGARRDSALQLKLLTIWRFVERRVAIRSAVLSHRRVDDVLGKRARRIDTETFAKIVAFLTNVLHCR